jgi:LmbE family N-acetylglucosaminyl deacetylase
VLNFPTPVDRAPRILGLFAHPDDEVFCMGGTVAKYVASGGAAKILSLTRGEAGQIRDVGVASRRTLGEVRERELVQAAKVLGVAETECFRFADGTLASQSLEPMIEQAAECIDNFCPDVVVAFGPDGAYGHPDHVASSQIATRSAAASRTRPTVLQAVFPRNRTFLVGLIVDWLEALDGRFLGSEEFAHGLMLFANGSSMLGYAADHTDVRFYPAGTYIIEQGERPGELFMVLSGQVDIYHESADGTLNHVAQTGPGSFIGQDGIARGQPRNAHVLATNSVTCFVLSPGRANRAAGRGDSSNVPAFVADDTDRQLPQDCIAVDVSDVAEQKLRALACHRSQYAIEAEMFPPSMVKQLFGIEYFVESHPDPRS